MEKSSKNPFGKNAKFKFQTDTNIQVNKYSRALDKLRVGGTLGEDTRNPG